MYQRRVFQCINGKMTEKKKKEIEKIEKNLTSISLKTTSISLNRKSHAKHRWIFPSNEVWKCLCFGYMSVVPLLFEKEKSWQMVYYIWTEAPMQRMKNRRDRAVMPVYEGSTGNLCMFTVYCTSAQYNGQYALCSVYVPSSSQDLILYCGATTEFWSMTTSKNPNQTKQKTQ